MGGEADRPDVEALQRGRHEPAEARLHHESHDSVIHRVSFFLKSGRAAEGGAVRGAAGTDAGLPDDAERHEDFVGGTQGLRAAGARLPQRDDLA